MAVHGMTVEQEQYDELMLELPHLETEYARSCRSYSNGDFPSHLVEFGNRLQEKWKTANALAKVVGVQSKARSEVLLEVLPGEET